MRRVSGDIIIIVWALYVLGNGNPQIGIIELVDSSRDGLVIDCTCALCCLMTSVEQNSIEVPVMGNMKLVQKRHQSDSGMRKWLTILVTERIIKC